MRSVMTKLAMAAAATAAIAAAPAMANSYRHSGDPMAHQGYAAEGYGYGQSGYDAYAAVPEGNVIGAPGVVSYDRYAGWDPDPAIRLQLKRDPTGGDSQ